MINRIWQQYSPFSYVSLSENLSKRNYLKGGFCLEKEDYVQEEMHIKILKILSPFTRQSWRTLTGLDGI